MNEFHRNLIATSFANIFLSKQVNQRGFWLNEGALLLRQIKLLKIETSLDLRMFPKVSVPYEDY